MNCYWHPEQEVQYTCANCQTPFCMECATQMGQMYFCPECRRRELEQFAGHATTGKEKKARFGKLRRQEQPASQQHAPQPQWPTAPEEQPQQAWQQPPPAPGVPLQQPSQPQAAPVPAAEAPQASQQVPGQPAEPAGQVPLQAGMPLQPPPVPAAGTQQAVQPAQAAADLTVGQPPREKWKQMPAEIPQVEPAWTEETSEDHFWDDVKKPGMKGRFFKRGKKETPVAGYEAVAGAAAVPKEQLPVAPSQDAPAQQQPPADDTAVSVTSAATPAAGDTAAQVAVSATGESLSPAVESAPPVDRGIHLPRFARGARGVPLAVQYPDEYEGEATSSPRYIRAVLFGLLAGLFGALLYAVMAWWRHKEFGVLFWLVGMLVGIVVVYGSGKHFNWKLGVASTVITLLFLCFGRIFTYMFQVWFPEVFKFPVSTLDNFETALKIFGEEFFTIWLLYVILAAMVSFLISFRPWPFKLRGPEDMINNQQVSNTQQINSDQQKTQ